MGFEPVRKGSMASGFLKNGSINIKIVILTNYIHWAEANFWLTKRITQLTQNSQRHNLHQLQRNVDNQRSILKGG